MKQDLAKFSIVPSKTFKTFLPILEKKFMRHMIRGMIDGDGYIGHYIRNSLESNIICLTGRPFLLQQFKDYLIKELGINNNSISIDKNGVGTIAWSSKKDIKILKHYLYSDATIFLKRKFEKLSNVL